jgi:phosphatidylglycerol lysyltransferase
MATEQVFDRTHKLRTFVPALVSAIIVWLCVKAVGPVDVANVWATFVSFSPETWLLAAVLTWLSFKAVSKYDPLVAKFLNLNIDAKQAEKMGWKATAIAQLAGFGLFTGSFVRWCVLTSKQPDKDKVILKQAFTLTCGVTATFFLGWLFTLGLAVTLASAGGQIPPVFGYGAAAILAAFCLSRVAANKLPFRVPSFGFVAKSTNLAALDTLCAAGIIFAFLPDSYDSFLNIYLIFLLSFAIGMVSGFPGGLGPFEVSMMYLLPEASPSELIPAFLAFRLIYYVVPAFLAIAALVLGKSGISLLQTDTGESRTLPGLLSNFSTLGADLIYQNQLQLVHCNVSNSSALISSKNAVDIVFRSPISNRIGMKDSISSLLSRSASRGNKLCIYQCDPSTAIVAKHAGMIAFKFSSEAIVKTSDFIVSSPQFAKLRRKTRKALKENITVNSNHFDFADLSSINRSWSTQHGTEHGLSTGRFSKSLISRQRIYVAFQSSRPVAFVTFSTSESNWTLDLIRHQENCPDGTIYTLISHAIFDAKLEHVDAVSLGCVPMSPPMQDSSVSGRIAAMIFQRSGSLKGLYQFKQVFAPNWQERHVAFSSIFHIPASIFGVFQAIHHPPKIEETS